MAILIYGAGAVGCLLGGALAAGGRRVILVGRPSVLDPVANHGLRVSLPQGERSSRPGVAESLEEAVARIGRPEAVIVTVKAFQTDRVAAGLAPLEAVPVLTVQNGLGNEEALAATLGSERVVAGALTLAASWSAPGQVVAGGKGGLALAPVAQTTRGSAALQLFAEAFRSAGLSLLVTGDFRSLKWSKLLLNILANATCAAVDMLPEAFLASRQGYLIERAAFAEAAAVMRADGARCLDLPGYPVRLLRRLVLGLPSALSHRLLRKAIAGSRGGKPPSLLLDLRAGRGRTEVAWLNGAIARRGEATGRPAPVNAALARLVEGLASGHLSRDAYAGRIDLLAREVGLAPGPPLPR